MNIFLATLGDPIWQIGKGILLLVALVLLLALRSPEIHLLRLSHIPLQGGLSNHS
jgi:hypothetical protein